MNRCSEYDLDDMTAVTAIPVGNISAYAPGSVANRLTATIATGFSPSLEGAVTIGLRPAARGVTLVPMYRGTGKAKDDESDGAAGRLHTVTVTCEADGRDGAAWETLLLLERTPSHLLLTFRGGTQAFVSATEDTYLCTVERSGGKTTVTFRVQDLMGVQLIA